MTQFSRAAANRHSAGVGIFWLSCSSLAIASVVLISGGCQSINSRVRGSVEAEQRDGQLVVEYDLHLDRHDLDSVSLQIFTPGNEHQIHYPAEAKAKDSLYQLYRDDCCYDIDFRDMLMPDSMTVRFGEELGKDLCWWSPRLLPDRLYFPSTLDWWKHVDSVLTHADPDSLRRISVPCSWKNWGANHRTRTAIDTSFQHDSVIFRAAITADSMNTPTATDVAPNPTRIDGELCYQLEDSASPTTYCLKFYGQRDDSQDPRIPSILWRPDPSTVIWEWVLPDEPAVEKFDFEDRGQMIGAFASVGVSESDRQGLPSAYASGNNEVLFEWSLGLSYYTAKTQFDLGFGVAGHSDSANTSNAYQFLYGSAPSVRWYPFTRTSYGPIIKGGLVAANLEIREQQNVFEQDGWGVMTGFGFETNFDRIEYSYVTALDGYHQIDILLGSNALRHGKEGLLLVLRHGKTVRFASVQLYVGNRVLWRTINPHNPRSKVVTALLWIGVTAAWSAIY